MRKIRFRSSFKFRWKVCKIKVKKRKLILLQLSLFNVPEYAWMCLYKQDSKYASGPKYAKILNMAKFWIWQGSQYASVTQRSNYTKICLGRVLNISRVLNMPGFWIWQGSEYERITQGSKYATICLNRTWTCLNMSKFTVIDKILNMHHTIHSARSPYKLMNTYWQIGVFRTRSKIQDVALKS